MQIYLFIFTLKEIILLNVDEFYVVLLILSVPGML